MWASLVPAAAVIPAHQVFFIIVVVKKFLAMNKLDVISYWGSGIHLWYLGILSPGVFLTSY